MAVVLPLVALAILLRLAGIDAATLHEDEAYFAAHGLDIVRTGDLAVSHTVASPLHLAPFLPWLVALSIAILGDGPLAIRIPDLLASAVATAALTITGLRLAGLWGGVMAGLLYALSPFAIVYDASVFADPLAIALGMAGFAAVASGRPGLAGILLGLAAGAKLSRSPISHPP